MCSHEHVSAAVRTTTRASIPCVAQGTGNAVVDPAVALSIRAANAADAEHGVAEHIEMATSSPAECSSHDAYALKRESLDIPQRRRSRS